ncbi:hypothetical protein EDC30_11054 [Paucimonas lemoignei]|uniref:SIR2-like domain-containing protein n=1 Tax=Paucimonas lemoignei TaxID=29443 RepID=A0A4R3HR55_PAULE|nr:hypothetical protein [Paucimonas lemoignei]TCS35586.1 hypothetical protein EDC30_11054 [Paucimonas lemoignei]
MSLKDILKAQCQDLALLIGNGINRYGAEAAASSWDGLLSTLAQKLLDPAHAALPSGMSLTEFYDVLELSSTLGKGKSSLQAQFCELLASWQPQAQHKRVMQWAHRHDVPVLTTNFENTLGNALGCTLQRVRNPRFTAYYPWERYYGLKTIDDPCKGFGVWHINGMQCYRQSIRLGLTHYMGAVERARALLYRGTIRLFSGADINAWVGASTWLQIVFHKPLLIFGLGLSENEVFLRWLLIERAKYYRVFPERRKPAWYVHSANEKNEGKLYFLRAVGVETVGVPHFDDIYGEQAWALPAA